MDEVGGPTILATLTVIAALLPMAFVTGLGSTPHTLGAAEHDERLAFLSHLGEVPSEFVERGRVALPVALARSGLSQEGDGQLSGRQQIGSEAPENFSADPFLFPQEAEQEMFAPDMIVAQESGFLDTVFDDFFDARAEGNFPERHGRPAAGQIPLDFEPDLFRGESHLF